MPHIINFRGKVEIPGNPVAFLPPEPSPEECPNFLLGSEENPFVGNVNLTTDADIVAFGTNGYDAIIGNLYISDLLSDAITDLSPLNTLRYVSQHVEITYNSALPSLEGLWGLQRIGGDLIIVGNDLITQVGFNNLYQVDGEINIQLNPLLNTIDDSFQCLHIVGRIYLSGNGEN